MWTSLFQESCIAQGLSTCVRSRPSGSDLLFSRPVPEILVFLAVRFPAAFFRVPSTPCPFLLQDGHFSLSAVLLLNLPCLMNYYQEICNKLNQYRIKKCAQDGNRQNRLLLPHHNHIFWLLK